MNLYIRCDLTIDLKLVQRANISFLLKHLTFSSGKGSWVSCYDKQFSAEEISVSAPASKSILVVFN